MHFNYARIDERWYDVSMHTVDLLKQTKTEINIKSVFFFYIIIRNIHDVVKYNQA